VARFGLVLHVRSGDSNTALALLRGVINLRKIARHTTVLLG
jgi:hypothetical protein